jgi:hypothetical protein
MSFAYPDAGLAFRGDGNLAVVGRAYRDVVRGGITLRSMPRPLSLVLIDPAGKIMGIKSFSTQTIGMSELSCHFVCNFDLDRDLATKDRPEGDWTLRLTGEFRAEDGSMSESTIERKIRIATPPEIPPESIYLTWEPTPPKDGDFGLTWLRPRPQDVFAGLPIPVTIRAERAVTGHYPVLELLDNANKVVVTSLWFKSWSRSAPQLRTTVKAPKDLDGSRNTHQFRLSMIAPEISSGRSAASYQPFRSGETDSRPTIQSTGAGGPVAASFSPSDTQRSKAVARANSKSKPAEVIRVHMNEASAADIARKLPGIGPALAKKIIAARPIESLDQLVAIPGISPMMVESIRSLVEW